MSTGHSGVFRRKTQAFEKRNLSPSDTKPGKAPDEMEPTARSRLRNSSSTERKPSFLIRRSDSSSRSATDLNQYSNKLDETTSKKSVKKERRLGGEASVTTQVQTTQSQRLFQTKISPHDLYHLSVKRPAYGTKAYEEPTNLSSFERTHLSKHPSMRSMHNESSTNMSMSRVKTLHFGNIEKLIQEQVPRGSFKISLKSSTALYEKLQAKASSTLEFSKSKPLVQLREGKKPKPGNPQMSPKRVEPISGFDFKKKVYPNNKWLVGTSLKENVKDLGILSKQQISHDLFRLQRSLSLITNVRSQEISINLLTRKKKNIYNRKSTLSQGEVSKDLVEKDKQNHSRDDSKSSDNRSDDFRAFDYVRGYTEFPAQTQPVYYNLEEAVLGNLQFCLINQHHDFSYMNDLIRLRASNSIRLLAEFAPPKLFTTRLADFVPKPYNPGMMKPRYEFELLIRNKSTKGYESNQAKFDQDTEATELVTLWEFPIIKLLSKDPCEILKIREFPIPELERRVLSQKLVYVVFAGLADGVTDAMLLTKAFEPRKSHGHTIVIKPSLYERDPKFVGSSQTSIDIFGLDLAQSGHSSGGVAEVQRGSIQEMNLSQINQMTKLKMKASKRLLPKSGFNPETDKNYRSTLSPDKLQSNGKSECPSVEKFWGQHNLNSKIFELLVGSDEDNWEFYRNRQLESNTLPAKCCERWLKFVKLDECNGMMKPVCTVTETFKRVDSGKSIRSRKSNKSARSQRSILSKKGGKSRSPDQMKQPILIIKPNVEGGNQFGGENLPRDTGMDLLSPQRFTVGKLLAAEFFLNPNKRRPTSLSNRNISTSAVDDRVEQTKGQSRRNSMKKIDSEKSLSIEQQSGVRMPHHMKETPLAAASQGTVNFDGIRMATKTSLNAEGDETLQKQMGKFGNYMNISTERTGSVRTANNLVKCFVTVRKRSGCTKSGETLCRLLWRGSGSARTMSSCTSR